MAEFVPGPTGSEQVLFARDGVLGRVLLNRPRAINSLTREMVVAVRAQLQEWVEDPGIAAVSLEGAGEKGLCAGGDIRAVREAHLAGTSGGVDFWADEYVLDAQIAEYDKPVIAVMDGIVMGGGLGISMFAAARWTTPRSKVAMPETKIGFFPDVAATYRLSRAPGELGTHLALTGNVVDGWDAVELGLADAVIDPGEVPGLLADVAAGGPVEALPSGRIEAPFEAPFEAPSSHLRDRPSSHLDDPDTRAWIDECYTGDDPAAILERLRSHPAPAAKAAAEEISLRSPLSVAVTLEALRRARSAVSPREVLATDTVLSGNLLRRPDFVEGVRALLVDKDNRPRWEHPDVAAVPRAEVLELFNQ